MAIPSTASRVKRHTKEEINERIRKETESSVAYYSLQGPQAVEKRLQELDREWDIERAIEANASFLALTGIVLGATVKRSWFLLPFAVTGFLLQHALQGWCPPVPLFRRLGYRTAQEIEAERYALKLIRGDFARYKETLVDTREALKVAGAR
jgi:hypothetical protein